MTRQRAIKTFSATVAVALALAGLAASAQAAAPAWRVLAAANPTHLPPVTKEVQRLAVDASGGTFTLAFEGHSTGALPFNAQTTAIQSALDALPSISGVGGEVTVTGGPGNPGAENPYLVNFGGALAGQDVPELTADGSGLHGGAGSVTVTTSVAGKDSFAGGSLALGVTNVGGAEASAFTASIGPLPPGFASRLAFGNGWGLCFAATEGATVTCPYQSPVPAGEGTFTLKIPLTVKGSVAAPSSTLPITISGGGAPSVTYHVPLVVSSTPARPGIAAFWAGAFDADGNPEVQAGSHPHGAATAFWLNSVLAPDGTTILPASALRTANVGLPPGFLGDPLVTQKRCPQEALDVAPDENTSSPLCTKGAAMVGLLWPAFGGYSTAKLGGAAGAALMNDVPAFGSAAQFSANVAQFGHVSLFGSVRSDTDFGVDVAGLNLATQAPVWGNYAILEGFPASAPGKAFLRNPTDCSVQREEAAAGRGPVATLQMNSWANPDPKAIEDEAAAVQPVITGCGALTQAWLGHGPEPGAEEPSFSFQPTTTAASSPTGATAALHVPQAGLTDPNKLATSDLKKTVVTLPEGLNVNPSSANGLAACSEAQVGYKGSGFPMPTPIRFDEAPVSCPEASRIGTAQIKSPLVEEELGGTIYLAAQEENPFHSLLALYLVVESKRFGITLKLPGEVRPDPDTGRLTASFDNNPQLPFEDLTLRFRGGGPRSTLATPETCGHFESTGSLEPWSAEHGEALAIHEAGFDTSGGCASSAAARPFSPSFVAGTASTQAGAYAPLTIRIARKDGEQELTSLNFTLPPGLTGKLAGIPYCPDAAIAAAAGKSGKAEQASPSCPAASQLGTVDTGAGYGSEPIHVGGHVYLAGPYKGAPLSAVVITPAVAGPFDLGDVVVRAGLYVDPETAQITAKSDEIPHILKGIPLKLRSVDIKVDRQGFALNPTSCNAMTTTTSMSGLNGGSAKPSSRFQVGGCRGLAFNPQLKLSVIGKTNRNAKPRLKAVLTANAGASACKAPSRQAKRQSSRAKGARRHAKHLKGAAARRAQRRARRHAHKARRLSRKAKDCRAMASRPEANIRRAQVNLPHSEFLEQNHIKTVCTRVQFAKGNGNGSECPKGSIYGRAKAWTPLLDHPLEGFVYLRSNGGERKLPDLVAALNGQINVALWGKVDSGENKGIRNTFEVVPDAPVSRFVLEMNGGKKGLLVNSENLCSKKAKRQAIVRLTGQNGAVKQWKPKVANDCKHKKKSRKAHAQGRKG